MKKIIGFAILSLLIMTGSAFAMGVVPPISSEAGSVSLEFLKEYGFGGNADAQFYLPQDVAVSVMGDISTGLGNIFVADTGNNRIERLDDGGTFINQFGLFGTDLGRFNTPTNLAIDFNLYMYVSDQENHRIQKFDIRGNPLAQTGSYGKQPGNFMYPQGLAIDPIGNVYIADTGNDRIQKFDSGLNFQSSFGGFGVGDGFFDGPKDLAIDHDQNIYVADTGNNRIQKLDNSGRTMFAAGGLYHPQGIAVDDSYVSVSDTGNNRLAIFSKRGRLLATYGDKGTEPGKFNSPMGISVGRINEIYVADMQNNRIQKFKVMLK